MKGEASGLFSPVAVNALSSVQCFDTLGWMTRRTSGSRRTVPLILLDSLVERMEEKNQGEIS